MPISIFADRVDMGHLQVAWKHLTTVGLHSAYT
jgi:hypothetical protein